MLELGAVVVAAFPDEADAPPPRSVLMHFFAICALHYACTVRLPAPELAAVHSAVGPLEEAYAVSAIVHVLPNVAATMHLALLPLTIVATAVLPDMEALAPERVVLELASVRGTSLVTTEDKVARAALDPIPVLAHISGAVWDGQGGLAMLLPMRPFTLVGCAVRAHARTLAVCVVVHPEPHVDITVGVFESASAMCLATVEVAHVLVPVGPELDTLSIRQVASPLAGVLPARRSQR
mmetsp:Transcript_84550/g.196607  ORF Transcript_84550/g.196607 Transcript_84550/m.196607 type:complete len:237 (-) Transcript_84550:209-919(-)